MKNALFVEFILQIRGTCLFLHIVNKRLHPCEQKPGHPAPNRRFGTFRIKAPRPGQSKRHMQLTLRQRRPQTARPTTLTIERPEYHEKTTHILNGIGGPAGGRMLHGKQGRRHGIRHAEGQLHRRRFDRRRIGRHFPDAGCALRPPSRRFHAYGHRRIGDAAVGYAHGIRAERRRVPNGNLRRLRRTRRPRCGGNRQTLLCRGEERRGAAPPRCNGGDDRPLRSPTRRRWSAPRNSSSTISTTRSLP